MPQLISKYGGVRSSDLHQALAVTSARCQVRAVIIFVTRQATILRILATFLGDMDHTNG